MAVRRLSYRRRHDGCCARPLVAMMQDVVSRLREGAKRGPNTAPTPWGVTIEEAAVTIERMRDAFRRIERITWREGHGEQAKLLLLDCRKIAFKVLTEMRD